jgi:radical SAM-linked protein
MVCDKVRIRFRKTADLRFISHHDLMRCFERMLRRAELPFHSTSGFNPKPRLVFAMPLPLGIIGCEEVAELELDAEVPPEEVCTRLVRQAPAGLEIIDARRIDGRTTAHVRRVRYCVRVPESHRDGLPARIASLLASAECWIERQRPEHRSINLRPYVSDVRLLPDVLELELIVTPQGTARPDEVLAQLGLSGLLDAGAVLERTAVELDDEFTELGKEDATPESTTRVLLSEENDPQKGTP